MQKLLSTFYFGVVMVFALQCEAQLPPGSVLWSCSLAGTVTPGPAVAPDGTIYVGTSAGLCAVSSTGSNKWTFTAKGSVVGSPAIGSDGTVYFGANSQQSLNAVTTNGFLRWSLSLGMNGSSPIVGEDNGVCVVGANFIYSINSEGMTNWAAGIDDIGSSTPVMARNSTIYALGRSGLRFYAFNGDGSSKFAQLALTGQSGDTLAIGGDGTLYAAWGKLYAFAPDGTKLWANQTASFGGGASPAVGPDGTIYVASDRDFSLYAFSPAGSNLWHAAYGPNGPGNYVATTPAIDASGMIYYASSNSIFALNSSGQIQWIFSSPLALLTPPPPPYPTPASPAIGPDGTIYAAFGNVLYALQGSGKPLATAPWPMLRQNLRHTGKVEKPSLAPPKKRADANFDIQLAGEIGQAYTVQSTTNFLNWTSITSFVASTLPMSVADLAATNAPKRFYRATTP